MMYNTPMLERINIWGKAGCELPNGKLCTACCVYPNIELEGSLVSVAKSENSPCPYLKKNNDGCSRHGTKKPINCTNWHCSGADNQYKLELIIESLALKQVTFEEAERACLQWDKKCDTVWIGKEEKRLVDITQHKTLIENDLIEP